ncbi:MAG: hypothetical protein QOE70_6762 [Chthoniobacter sp.]|jgi:pimeloyl-ACP methyl ester carboxylesterase|nr:hypothetical protein [Chthoniobacter sp.]
MNKLFSLAATIVVFTGAHLFADDFDSAGVKIHYTVQGRGEPVILIHGLFANGPLNWSGPGITAALAKRAQVILVDCRGHGLSDKPSGEHDYGVQMVEDLGRLMDHLHLSSAHLIGYSMGAMITLKFASLHPERVRSAILGGAGWMEDGALFERFASGTGGTGPGQRNAALGSLLAGFSEFSVPAEAVKSLRVPIEIIIGEQDFNRRLGVEPLLRLRPDLTEHVIADANHLTCVIKPQFKAEVEAALTRHLAKERDRDQPTPR